MSVLANAVSFATGRGGVVEQARLHYLLTQEPPTVESMTTLLSGQRPDGGWAPLWASHCSGIDATCFRLAQAEAAGVRAAHPAITKAIGFLTNRQFPNGSWEEDALLGAMAPSWAKPGDEQATLYLTANAGSWVAVLNGPRTSAVQGAEYLVAHLASDGHLPSFFHTHWVAGSLLWFLGERPTAERIFDYLHQRVAELHTSNLAWLMTSLIVSGVPVTHRLIQSAAMLLEHKQEQDGRWVSEDGPDWDLHSTLEALRALRLCGRL